MTGAFLWQARPATIIKSDWRGEGLKTSAPKRAISNREAPIDIISMAQQARPNVIGHIELLRTQLHLLAQAKIEVVLPRAIDVNTVPELVGSQLRSYVRRSDVGVSPVQAAGFKGRIGVGDEGLGQVPNQAGAVGAGGLVNGH